MCVGLFIVDSFTHDCISVQIDSEKEYVSNPTQPSKLLLIIKENREQQINIAMNAFAFACAFLIRACDLDLWVYLLSLVSVIIVNFVASFDVHGPSSPLTPSGYSTGSNCLMNFSEFLLGYCQVPFPISSDNLVSIWYYACFNAQCSVRLKRATWLMVLVSCRPCRIPNQMNSPTNKTMHLTLL